MMYWYDHGMSGWGYVLMTLNMLLFWGLVIAAIVLLVRYVSRSRPHPTGPDAASPSRILAERFARGEIDEEEYQQRADILRRGEHNVAKR